MSDKDTTNNIHTLAPVSLDAVLEEIAHWRENKPTPSAAMPDSLWCKIFTLAKTHQASKIRVLLGISTKQYNSKYEQIFTHAAADKKQYSEQAQTAPIDFHQVKTSLSPSPSLTSLYKPLKIPDPNTIIAEFCHADGRIMKIHSTSESFHQLIHAFFQDMKSAADNVKT